MKIKFINQSIVGITILICTWFYNEQGRHSYTFYGDASGYYSYLPSAFIYHNFHAIDSLPLDKNIEEPIIRDYKAIRNSVTISKKGILINQYTYGVALLEFPFFALAHMHAVATGADANGYSSIYHYWVKASSILYGVLGLLFVYFSCLHFFSKTISLLASCLVLIATNLFWFTFFQSGMAHVPLFFLYAVLVYYTILLHQRFTLKYFVIIGFTAGCITIIRPSDLVCIIIPLAYGIYNKQSLIHKFQALKSSISKIVLSIIFFIIPILPQLFFWKKYTGHYFYNSYGAQSFHWMQPQIMKGLFGFSNGWLSYTPFFFIGIFSIFFYKKLKNVLLIFILLVPLYIYITYSWYCFNYINGFGSRPMIHLYPLLIIPSMTVIQYCLSNNIFTKISISCLIGFSVFYNVKLSWQQAAGKLISENASANFIKQTLFKKNISAQDLVTMDCDIVQPPLNNIRFCNTVISNTRKDSLHDYLTLLPIEYPDVMLQDSSMFLQTSTKNWVRCVGEFYMAESKNISENAMMVLEIVEKNETKLWKAIKINNKIGLNNGKHLAETIVINHAYTHEWDSVEMYVQLPSNFSPTSVSKLFIWNIPQQQILVRNFRMELWVENP